MVWKYQRTVLLHHLQELDDHFGAGSDHDLALAGLLGVVDGLERIVEDGCFDHFGGSLRFSGRNCGVRCLQRCVLAFKSHLSVRVPFSAVKHSRVLQLGHRGRSSVIVADAMSSWPWLPKGPLVGGSTYLVGAASL